MPAEPQFEAYLASDGGAAARTALLSAAFWTAAYQDGRENVAMLALVDAVRAMKQRGLPVELLLFDAKPEDVRQRDRLMSENVSQRHAQHPRATFVLVMGNLHARKRPGRPWKPDDGYAWLTSLLPWPVVSLDAAHRDGTAWTCPSPKAEECGPHVVAARDSTGRRSVRLEPSSDGYDGVYDVVLLRSPSPAPGTPPEKR